MTDALGDPKRAAILASAWQAFATYGFRKTSMDDIASGAGMSRPAVYLHYKNKEAIVRSLTEEHYHQKIAEVEAALSQPGPVADTLVRAIAVQSDGMAEILASPHGLEMLDTSKSTASDIVTKGEAALTEVYSAWLEREHQAGRVKTPDTPHETARTITAAVKGIKMTASNAEEFEQRLAQLAALLGSGLQVV